MDHTYVAMSGEHPTSAYTDLNSAQKAVVDQHTQYMPDGYETEWQEEPGFDDTRVWQLRGRGLGRRWSKAYRSIVEVPNRT
ncbi:hypothetical protein RMN57_13070 [Kitasatospora sp. CM 4170]|uniref:Uncharacterized protein n=1 Tax=Kitasatospora aburaviensis TaxID=67265 RepID=A0ABW1F2W9_9ACTN|nr:hypothetical protein [Kitasatospora sp. CM 4170]WNM45585.1 hypothetical protein RMN57_13070 [Kitasatospora sp. CM 4170]